MVECVYLGNPLEKSSFADSAAEGSEKQNKRCRSTLRNEFEIAPTSTINDQTSLPFILSNITFNGMTHRIPTAVMMAITPINAPTEA
jgi:hypothetical protein